MLATKKHSQNDVLVILNSHRLPARLNAVETSILLGFQEHDIATLVAARLLVALGKPAPNAPKYFASTIITGLAGDVDWLGKATKAIAAYWRKKNSRTGKVAKGS